jgi:hypothetical protein
MTRADEPPFEEQEDSFPLHVVDFHWEEFDPHMECYDSSEKDFCEIDLEDVGFSVSRKKVCIGQWKDGGYLPCPDHALVTRFEQCAKCAGVSFIPDQECVFEPKCDGTNPKCNAEGRDMEFCRREHVLYLAFYDTRMKIGMSSTRRIDKRLIEQGADAYSIIGKFGSRLAARTKEKELSARLRIPQFYRQVTLLQNLSRPVDSKGVESRLEGIRETLRSPDGLDPEPLVWLDRYPIDLPLRQTPVLVESWGRHSGELVGMKGKWLVFDSNGLKALSLPDFPARFLARTVA